MPGIAQTRNRPKAGGHEGVLLTAVLTVTAACFAVRAEGLWIAAPSMSAVRADHSATLLNDGRVLIAGGSTATGETGGAELFDPVTQAWTATGSLAGARYTHSASLLNDGKVLVAGGWGASGVLASAELYDAAAGAWTGTNPMGTARQTATATLLSDGKVLVAGGWSGSAALATAELYDPGTGTWSPTAGTMAAARYEHTATLLVNGMVLVAGGRNGGGAVATAELYNPATGLWTATGNTMAAARYAHAATRLSDGKVLVVGGDGGSGPIAGAELFDPATGMWAATQNAGTARRYAAAALFSNGRILVCGGNDGTDTLASAELYDPATGTWAAAAGMATAREAHTLTPVNSNARALAAGGMLGASYLASAAIFDPAPAPPTISSVAATAEGMSTETVMTGVAVTFSAAASDPNNAVLSYTWDFRDGGTATGNPATHTYSQQGEFQVTVTVSNGAASATGSVTLQVYTPSSTGAGQPIVSQVIGAVVTDPLTGVRMSVASSNGGVVELFVDLQNLGRDDFDVITNFYLPSRAAYNPVRGLRPVVKFDRHGIAIATANVTKTATNEYAGKGRKMLPLSVLETADPDLPALPMPTSRYVAVKSLKGKFNFSGRNDAKPDAVALSGTIELAAGLDISKDQELWIGAGNIVDRIMLDPKGNAKSRSTGDNGRIKKVKIKWPRLGKGVTTTSGGEHAQASVTLNLVDMDKAGFDTEGVTGQLRPDEAGQTSVPRQVQLAIVLGGVSYETLSDVEFKVSKGLETGQITLPSRH